MNEVWKLLLFEISVIKLSLSFSRCEGRAQLMYTIFSMVKMHFSTLQNSFTFSCCFLFGVLVSLSLSSSPLDHWIHTTNKINDIPMETWWKHKKWIPKIVVTFCYRTNLFCVFCGKNKEREKKHLHTHTWR